MIRSAGPADAVAIVALLRDSFAEQQSEFSAEAFAASTPGVDEVRQRIADDLVWVAENSSGIVGTVTASPRSSYLYVRSFVVGPRARGSGTGALLLAEVDRVAVARGVAMELDTTLFQPAAGVLYQRFGFEETKRHEIYGTPMVRMRKGAARGMSDEHEWFKEADRIILEVVWSTGDVDRLDEIVAGDIVHHDPFDQNAADGLAGMKRTIASYREAFPDVRFQVEDQLAEADKVLTRWSSVGTHTGSLMGETPTGKTVQLTGMVVERFEDGKIVEAWRNWDILTLLQRIGVL